VFATLPRQATKLPERHLGLVQAAEIDGIEALLDTLAQQLDFGADAWNSLRTTHINAAPCAGIAPLLAGKTVAIARDAAFAFIYPANLQVLADLGATVAWFSPLSRRTPTRSGCRAGIRNCMRRSCPKRLPGKLRCARRTQPARPSSPNAAG
jgi:cobyrinic acid a,c-diamide synthase